MKIGVVVGVVWASKKVTELDGIRMCIVQPVSCEKKTVGNTLVVSDPLGLSASGDTIVYVTSADAAEAFENGYAPVDASIVQLVHSII